MSDERTADYEKGAAVDLIAMGAADPNSDNANLLTARQSPGYLLVKDLVADMATRRSRPRAAGVRPAGASRSSTRSTACGTTAKPATAKAPTSCWPS